MCAEARCRIVAEVAQSHDGSLGMAHAFVDAIANAGADVVKFQTHIADAESTPDEPWRVPFSYEDKTRYDYWKRMEFTEEQWRGLKEHASQRGLGFISSPFSLQAVDLLERVGPIAWKVASGEINNLPMFERMAATRLPIILSTGMSPIVEIDGAVDLVKSRGIPLTVLQCTSAYPCPPEKVGLNLIPFFQSRYDCDIGLSDHSGTIYPGLAAATMDINMLEVHVALSREMFGPDVQASITTSELRELIKGIRFIEKMRSSPVDKNAAAEELAPLRDLFMRSVVSNMNLPEGTILTHDHLGLKKPGTGIPPAQLKTVLGKRLRRPVRANQVLTMEDLESPTN